MQPITLGKIPVPTPGTQVPISLTQAQKALLPPSGNVQKIEVWPDPADTGVAKVFNGGVLVAGLPSPGTAAGGHAEPYRMGTEEGNMLNPNGWSVDSTVATNGPLVTFWVL